MRAIGLVSAVSAVLMASACTGSPTGAGGGADGTASGGQVRGEGQSSRTITKNPVAAPIAGVAISGVVKAPPGVVTNNGGSIIANGGAGIITNNAAGIIANGGASYRLRALTESPLAGFEVLLADATGTAVPAVAPTKTDAGGAYTLRGVAPGKTYVLIVRGLSAKGKPAELRTIVRVDAGGTTTADISVATTMVAFAALDSLGAGVFGREPLSSFSGTTFATAAGEVARSADPGKLPDLADRSAIVAQVNALVAASPELKKAIEDLRANLAGSSIVPTSTTGGTGGSGAIVPGGTGGEGGTGGTGGTGGSGGTGGTGGGTPAPDGTPAPTGTPAPDGTTAPSAAPTPTPLPLSPATVRSLAKVRSAKRVEAKPDTAELFFPGGGVVQTATLGGLTADLTLADGEGEPIAICFDAGKRYDLIGNTITWAGGSATIADVPADVVTDFAVRGDAAYVVCKLRHTIYKVMLADGATSVLAGSGGGALKEGQGAEASFNEPTGIAAGADGLYVADSLNRRIRLVTYGGLVSTFTGGRASAEDGAPQKSGFQSPLDVAIDGAGILYVVDQGNHLVRRVSRDGYVDTLAGDKTQGNQDGVGAEAKFYFPTSITLATVDGKPALIVGQNDNNVRLVSGW